MGVPPNHLWDFPIKKNIHIFGYPHDYGSLHIFILLSGKTITGHTARAVFCARILGHSGALPEESQLLVLRINTLDPSSTKKPMENHQLSRSINYFYGGKNVYKKPMGHHHFDRSTIWAIFNSINCKWPFTV